VSDCIILGAGLAGLSTAYHLNGVDYDLFEMEDRIGGLCRTETVNGFTFDYTGHFLHCKKPEVKELVLGLMGDAIALHTRKSGIHLYDVVTPYPFQLNTFGHSADVRKDCLLGLIEAKYDKNQEREIKNFEDWILKTCGEGVAKHFMFPYNKKIWTVETKEMTTDWLSGYIPVPNIAAALDGALRDPRETVGYNANFYYPHEGGIEALPKALATKVKNIHLNSKAQWIDLKNRVVCIQDREYKFEKMVSTLPLNQLISLIRNANDEMVRLSQKLKHTSVLTVNLGVKREWPSDYHWLYFPEEKFCFYRAGFPSQLSSSMAPKGFSSVSVEISYSPWKPLPAGNIIQRVIQDLKITKLLTDQDEIVTTHTMTIPCAYVIYDRARTKILSCLQDYLRGNHIISIGRYGNWQYSAMEDAIFQGIEVAREIKGEK